MPGLRPQNWVDRTATAADRAGRTYTDITDTIAKAAEPVTKPVIGTIVGGIADGYKHLTPDLVKRGFRRGANWLANASPYGQDVSDSEMYYESTPEDIMQKRNQLGTPDEYRQGLEVEKAMVAAEVFGAIQGVGAIRNIASSHGLKAAGIPREMIEKAAEIGRGSKRSARQVLKDFADDPHSPIYDEIHAASSGLKSKGSKIQQAQPDPDQVAAFLKRKKATKTSDYKPGQSLENAPEIVQVRNRLLDSYRSGANREAFLGPKGLLRRRHPGKSDKELGRIYDEEVLPGIEKSIADTPARMFTDVEAVDKNLRHVAGQWARDTDVPGSDEIAMSPKTFNKPGPGGQRAKEGAAAHEHGHAIDYSPGRGKTGAAAGRKATLSGEQFPILKSVFKWLKRKPGKAHHQDATEIYTDIINSRATLGRSFTADDIRNIINNDGQILRGREFSKYNWFQTPNVPGYTVVPLLNAIKETLRGAGIARRNVPESMLQNMADKFNQVAQLEQPRREAEQPQVVMENALSSDQFLQLVEQVLYEEPRMTSWQGPPLADQSTLRNVGGWNKEAEKAMGKRDEPEDRIKHVREEEELEEVSIAANVEGSPGGAWGKDFTNENEEEAKKSHTLEENELVENIVNYLNNGVGVL